MAFKPETEHTAFPRRGEDQSSSTSETVPRAAMPLLEKKVATWEP